MVRLGSFTPFSAEADKGCGAGVLTFTAGGAVPEFHRLALQLSSWSPKNAPGQLLF
jgi:hypothetical protein